MGSLKKARTPKTDRAGEQELSKWNHHAQGWRPWVRETCCAAWKCKNWLCQEIVLPGINYCFLITAFSLQRFLASLLYLGLPWWLIKFQSRWLCRAAGDFHLPGKAGFALAKLQGHCQLFVLAVAWQPFWVCVTAQGRNLKVLFSQPCHCLGKQQAGYIYSVPPLSLSQPYFWKQGWAQGTGDILRGSSQESLAFMAATLFEFFRYIYFPVISVERLWRMHRTILQFWL